jgi:hypothetical protein
MGTIKMEPQAIINFSIGLAGFLGGWALNSVTKAIAKIEDRLEKLPTTYVSKDDYKDDIRRVHEMLDKIFSLLDKKADKH